MHLLSSSVIVLHHLLLHELLLGETFALGLFTLTLLEFSLLLHRELLPATLLCFASSDKGGLLVLVLLEHASLLVDHSSIGRGFGGRRRVRLSSYGSSWKIRRVARVGEIGRVLTELRDVDKTS
jgi:hypothetical protein